MKCAGVQQVIAVRYRVVCGKIFFRVLMLTHLCSATCLSASQHKGKLLPISQYQITNSFTNAGNFPI